MEGWRKNSVRTLLTILIISNILLISFNVYLLLNKTDNSKPKNSYAVASIDQKIKDIEIYLDSISSPYIADEQSLAHQNGLPSWGCGPSSYALAKILNKKFFDNQLIINASYNNKNPYEIVERFSLAQNGATVVDHNWLEIYLEDKFLFIDPTIGQFGKINKIAYQVFTVGQSDISDILKKQYGIDDIRLALLVPKVVNRIPINQDPYPGVTIAPSSIGYFLQVLEYRNDVNDGIEPPGWNSWVAFLTKKYE